MAFLIFIFHITNDIAHLYIKRLLNLCLFFTLGCLFSHCEFWGFIYSGYKYYVRYMICKYFQFVTCFHSLNNIFLRIYFFILMRLSLSFFSFIDYPLSYPIKEIFSKPQAEKKCSPVFSSESFIILDFVFRSRMHLEWIFIYYIRQGLMFFSLACLFACGYPVILLPFLEKTIFSPPLCLWAFV